jgi:acetyl-CoA carboxylase beta subunit
MIGDRQSQPAPEKRIRCPACEKLFALSELAEHQRLCPEMARLDEEIPQRGRNLRK